MAISIAQTRQAIATQISALSGFVETKLPPEYFGRVPNTVAHKAFAVQIDQIVAIPERQRLTVGTYVQNTVLVKFAYRLRPHDSYPIDYDASFDMLEDVINKVLSSYNAIKRGLVARFVNSRHTISDPIEYIIHEVNFSLLHTIAG